MVGLLLCFWRWPIFGRPQELPRESTSDFGKHIDALAELLERSHERDYAAARLAYYRQVTKEPQRAAHDEKAMAAAATVTPRN